MARSSSDPQAAMAEMLAQHGEQIGKLTADQQEVQRQFEQLRAIVDGLVQQDRRQQGYTPTPPPRWWQLEGADRDDAINTLHLWVDRVFRPCYERYADDLGPCWADHPLCLFLLDWLSEWHKYLYLRDSRSAGHLTAMAEWHARFLPIVAEMLRLTTHSCSHADEAAVNDRLYDGYPAEAR